VQEEHKRYAKNDRRRADVLDKDATRGMNGDLNEEKSIDMEEEVKVEVKFSRFLLFCERMKGLVPHCRQLKDRMKDKTIFYVDLLQPGPPPSRITDEMKPQASKRLPNRK
jgi:hypothetical protein